MSNDSRWAVTYEGAIRSDGSLFFPERLDHITLGHLRKTMGIYKFTNQYLNQAIPDEDQDFKKGWIKYYDQLPTTYFTFIFVDPAISLVDGADYTATVVAHVDPDRNWFIEMAYRQRITATDTVRWIFKLYDQYRPMAIGIEDVAYQKALLHFLSEESLRTGKMIPVVPVKRNSTISSDGGKRQSNHKAYRIRSLVPRFEFGKILLNQGLDDFILEYTTFPRGQHDDLLDALSSIEEIASYPDKPKEIVNVTNPADPRYEQEYRKRLHRQAAQGFQEE